MLNIHLTLPQVIGFIKTIVDRDPDHVAKSPSGGAGCMYTSINGHVLTPVCIVGQMFADLGLLRLLLTTPNVLTADADQHGACSIGGDFWNSLDNFGITADDDAKEFLREVQSKQDSGYTWGDAYAFVQDEYLLNENGRLDDEQRVIDRKREALANLFA